jgi:hypothetical protein
LGVCLAPNQAPFWWPTAPPVVRHNRQHRRIVRLLVTPE